VESVMFTKMIILGYYDGETSGVYAEDEASQVISRFELLSWDDQQNWRIFCVGRVRDGNALFRKLVELYRQFEDEHWPVWAPSLVPQDRRSEELEIRRALDSRVQYESLVLSTDFHKGAAKTAPITGELETFVQRFIRTGELQDFKTCKSLMG
jgi:hypothetical protein